jgi:cell fate regulator YaaT (PSP1 superfamily)
MNPQKLAGQCAKLKCCLNYEVDAYVEVRKQLPSPKIELYTKDNTFYHFKTDLFKKEITYSTDKNSAANLVTINSVRAFEVINMNKNGEKPHKLLSEADVKVEKQDSIDILEDSISRFDKLKKKKKKKKLLT